MFKTLKLKYIYKYLFGLLLVKPLAYILLGLNIRAYDKLPHDGPAIIVANHNSHLDAIVLLALFPLKRWRKLRLVGAEDYFFCSKITKWFATQVLDIIPICRDGTIPKEKIFNQCEQALCNNEIIFIFPEGTRGEPETLGKLHKGVCHLSSKLPEIPVIPIFLHGLGKCLPKGEALLVPFFIDVFINDALYYRDYKNNERGPDDFIATIKNCFINGYNIVSHNV